ncbi:MAG: YraN family protein [Planctomycetota bacterium]|nr:YraN family protein [Planctomycetota bacterium]
MGNFLGWLRRIFSRPGKIAGASGNGDGDGSGGAAGTSRSGGWRQKIGAEGEEIAARELERLGYRIVERNFRCRAGELDIVAEDGGATVFVEVKARRTESKGAPAESVHTRKRARMARAAMWYIRARRLPGNARYRFDVVSVLMHPEGAPDVKVLKNAFRLDEIGMGWRQ